MAFTKASVLGSTIGAAEIEAGAVTAAKLGTGAVTAAKLGYAPDAMVMVQRGVTDAASGINLAAAYTAAKALTPGGNPRSATNRAAVFLPNGTYELAKAAGNPGLSLDTDYVDLIGQSMAGTRISSTATIGRGSSGSGPTVEQTAFDIRIFGLTVEAKSVQDGSSSWGCQAFRITETNITEEISAVEIDSHDSIYKEGAFADVELGDAVDIISGTGVTRRSYIVVKVSSADLIKVYPDHDYDIADGTIRVTRFNWPSQYDHLTIIAPTQTNGDQYGGCFANGHLGGRWRNCVSHGGNSWRVTAWRHLFAHMTDCIGYGSANFVGDGNPAGRPGIDDSVWAFLSGRLERCVAIAASNLTAFGGCTLFGSPITADAVLIDCSAWESASGLPESLMVDTLVPGSLSFALGRECAGTLLRCRGGDNCFGGWSGGADTHYGTFSGVAEDCVASGASFGGGNSACVNSGELIRCRCTAMAAPIHLTGASLRDCELVVTTNDQDAIVLEDGASKILNCTLLVVHGGSGIPINDDGTARDVVCAHCRMNNASIDADGLGANVTNLIGTPANVVDDDLDV